MKKEAYVFWNAGICHVLAYPSQQKICQSKSFQRATRKARNLGFFVRVYCNAFSKIPKGAIPIGLGGYILPRG